MVRPRDEPGLRRQTEALRSTLKPVSGALEAELRAIRPLSEGATRAYEDVIELWVRLLGSGDVAAFRDGLGACAEALVQGGQDPAIFVEALRRTGGVLQRTLVLRQPGPPEALATELESVAALCDLGISALLDVLLKAQDARISDAREEGQFLLDLVIHDTTNIHTAAAGYLQLLAREAQLSQEAARYAAKATERLKAAERLFSQARKFSRVRVQRQSLEPIDLRAAASRAMADLAAQQRGRRVEFRPALPGDPVWVAASPLAQDLVANLLSNAAAFDRHDPLVVEVALARTVQEGVPGWALRISDRGPGIPQERRSQIFERFSEGRKAVHGTGLGLPIVRALAEAFGGRVWVEDRVPGKPAEGASFVVWLREAAAPSSGKLS